MTVLLVPTYESQCSVIPHGVKFSLTFDNMQVPLVTIVKNYSYSDTDTVSFSCVAADCSYLQTAQLAFVTLESQVYRVEILPGAVSMKDLILSNCFSS